MSGSIELISDFTIKEYNGGAEMVDDNIASAICTIIHKAKNIQNINPQVHYLVSNATSLPEEIKQQLMLFGNYSTIEHDYRIHYSREPHFFKEFLFPKHELINIDFLARAKNVFVQSEDHLECYKKNTHNTSINYYNLSTSIWSEHELNLLSQLSRKNHDTYLVAIPDNPHVLKGRDVAIKWCLDIGLDYELIPRSNRDSFYRNLVKYPTLVFLPIRKESFCRLVVEARCLNMNVITHRTYGAVKEPWYSMVGQQLIDFLKESSKKNISIIINKCLQN